MDIKRTILWVIFSMALVLLYDNWQRANGHASMFFPSATQQQAASAPAAGAAQGDVPKANTTAGTATPAVPGAPGTAPQAAAQPTGEKIIVTTDEVRAEIDTAGGILSRLELLNEHEKDGKPVVLFERDTTLGMDSFVLMTTLLISLVAGLLFGDLLISPRRSL